MLPPMSATATDSEYQCRDTDRGEYGGAEDAVASLAHAGVLDHPSLDFGI